MLTILCADALETLRGLPDESVQCCVTSPPYWGLRDYGQEGQLGLEKTPEEYVAKMVEVFREVRRVLKEDGTLWLNLGDSYGARGNSGGNGGITNIQASSIREKGWRPPPKGMKCKDLVGIPWMVAFALRADGWWLRQDIIWSKPNPMPESVTDRCTKAHEYLFLLTKSARYYYDADAIAEPLAVASISRLDQDVENQTGSDRVPGKTNGTMKAVRRRADQFGGNKHNGSTTKHSDGSIYVGGETRNKRSVWTVSTQPFKDSHFATFPPDLIKPCIFAGSKPGDVILDPFGGSGTTGMVALELGRKAMLIELNPEYVKLIEQRCDVTPGLALA